MKSLKPLGVPPPSEAWKPSCVESSSLPGKPLMLREIEDCAQADELAMNNVVAKVSVFMARLWSRERANETACGRWRLAVGGGAAMERNRAGGAEMLRGVHKRLFVERGGQLFVEVDRALDGFVPIAEVPALVLRVRVGVGI